MKKVYSLLLATLLITNAFSQTAEEIITGYVKAVGGEEAIRKNQTWKLSAKVDVGGMELPLVFLKAPNKVKIYATFQGMTFVQQAFDGTTAWKTNQMTMKAEKSTTEESANIAQELLEEPDAMITYKSLGYKVERADDEKVEGSDCYAIKMTKKPRLSEGVQVDNVVTYFIDKSTSALVMTRSISQEGLTKGSVVETLFSDYQEAGGIYVPFSMTFRVAGADAQTIKFEKAEPNVTIDDKEFAYETK
ncbi:MAG: outer membrane lipoprotein-sorting protein [Bacteroidota bacterium]